jgi:hypothetical protein
MSTSEDSAKFWSTFFDDNEREYCRGGEKQALIRTIVTCSQFNVKLPAWARKAIVEAYISLPKSWDDVFGRPVAVAKGKSVEAERRRRRIGVAVIRRVKELNSQDEPIGSALFRKVGKEFGVSGGIVSKIYYDEEMVGTFKLLNDPDEFYKEADEFLRAQREYLKMHISKGKNSKNF